MLGHSGLHADPGAANRLIERGYLFVALILVVIKLVQVALGR